MASGTLSPTTSAFCPSGPMSADTHLALLKQALAAGLAARIEHDLRREKRDAQRARALTPRWVDLTADDQQIRLDCLIRDPVRTALRVQMRDLGKQLYRLVRNTNTMLEIAEEIAALEPKRWDYRMNILDKAWDGIGEGHDRWWA
jgi:hypothetical protein